MAENKPRIVACSNEKCGKRFADIIGTGTVDIVRRGQQFVVTGQNFSIIGTCFACGEKTSLVIKDGQLDETSIKFKAPKSEETPPPAPPTPPTTDEPAVTPPEPTGEPTDPPTPSKERKLVKSK